MDIRKTKKLILLVDPESNCRLVDVEQGGSHFLIQFNKLLAYQYRDPNARDSLRIVGDGFGNLDIFRDANHLSSSIFSYPQEEEEEEDKIGRILAREYHGGAKSLITSETVYVDQIGRIVPEDTANSFRIVRKSYELKLSSNHASQTRLMWQLSYSTFKAFSPFGNQEIQVYHTTTRHEFYMFCKDFKLKDPQTNLLLKNVKWKLPYHENSDIKVFDTHVPESNLMLGEYQRLTVGVEVLEANGDFRKHLENLRNLSTHENIMDVISGQTDGAFDTFAYQVVFGFSMKFHVSMMTAGGEANRTDSDWIKVIRGIIKGLKFLHTLKIRHGKLRVDSVYLKENHTPKLMGLAHLEFVPDELKNWEYFSADVFDFGIILLNVMTDGVHGGDATREEDIPNLKKILDQFPPEDEEVKSLLSKILDQNYMQRPSIDEILEHSMFCDWQSRVDLLTEVSDFCELKKSEARRLSVTAHAVVLLLDNIEGPKVFGTDGWKGIFGNDDILEEAEKNRTYPYNYYSLTDLLRIFRNIIAHLTEFKKKYQDTFGNTKQETELIFRKKYPKLFTTVREVARVHLGEKFRYHFEAIDPDLQFNVGNINRLENPYTL